MYGHKTTWVIMNIEKMYNFLSIGLKGGRYEYFYYKNKVYLVNYTGKETILLYEKDYNDFLIQEGEVLGVYLEKLKKKVLADKVKGFLK